jgi:hypothetical protein
MKTPPSNDDGHDHDDSPHGNGEDDTTSDISDAETHDNEDKAMEERRMS